MSRYHRNLRQSGRTLILVPGLLSAILAIAGCPAVTPVQTVTNDVQFSQQFDTQSQTEQSSNNVAATDGADISSNPGDDGDSGSATHTAPDDGDAGKDEAGADDIAAGSDGDESADDSDASSDEDDNADDADDSGGDSDPTVETGECPSRSFGSGAFDLTAPSGHYRNSTLSAPLPGDATATAYFEVLAIDTPDGKWANSLAFYLDDKSVVLFISHDEGGQYWVDLDGTAFDDEHLGTVELCDGMNKVEFERDGAELSIVINDGALVAERTCGSLGERDLYARVIGTTTRFEFLGVSGGDDTGGFHDAVLIGGVTDLDETGGKLTLSVTVRDDDGDLVSSGLTTANFTFRNVTLRPSSGGADISADAVPTGISVVGASAGGRLTAVLVFDTSGSMGPGWWGGGNDADSSGRRAGGNAFIDQVVAGDEVAITEFDSSPRLLQDFTDSRTALRAAIQAFDDGGATGLWRAAEDALDRLATSSAGRGYVVLLTDGEDDGGSRGTDELISHALSQGSRILAVGLGTDPDFSELMRVASETGGTFTPSSDAAGLKAAFAGLGTGASTGYINVEADATYPRVSAGRYVVAGDLVVRVGSKAVTEPFELTAQID